MMRVPLLILSLALAGARADEPREITAGAWNYRSLLRDLQPGDTLLLEADDYGNGLPINGLHGRPDAWITIRGLDAKGPVRLLGDQQAKRNTIEIRDSSYVAIENLTLDGQGIDGVFAISARGKNVHHIRVENCTIIGHGASQNTVAISTKGPTWGWVIRRNRILGAGTGMYLGKPDGSMPFVAGLIEHNLIRNPIGYCIQIKHQRRRPNLPGMPKDPQVTILRHNVFIKGDIVGDSGARPNLLLGGFPNSGPGSSDRYEVYGNLFVHNNHDSLLQGTGRLSIHDNVFVDCKYAAISLQDHAGKKITLARVYNNTFYAVRSGVRFQQQPRESQLLAGNLVFGRTIAEGHYSQSFGNLLYPPGEAAEHVKSPSLELGRMDFHPLPGKCEGDEIPAQGISGDLDFDRDFDGNPKGNGRIRGAYATAGGKETWALAPERKPVRSTTARSPANEGR